MSIIRNIKGTKDRLPDETVQWRWLETHLHRFMASFGYGEIRTPVFENTELFSRGIGTETDIVSKEMYTWEDQGKSSLTLRPELTAPVVRAFIQNNLQSIGPITKLYYVDSLFRRERPQAGRQRQFHQFGIEAIGSEHPEQDVEVISIAYGFYKNLGLENLFVRLNSIGSSEIREGYLNALRESLISHSDKFCNLCQTRLNKNALRMFDCKISDCKQLLDEIAPKISEFLTEDDKNHYAMVKSLLHGLKIPFIEDKSMVRGLDYYTRTTFEITSDKLGAQDALCGGGRYDNLIEQLGGKPTPAVGFAAGMERLFMVIGSEGLPTVSPVEIYIVALGEDSVSTALKIAEELRNINGISVIVETLRRSLKAQMREANRQNSRFAVIIGEEEIQNQSVRVRNMENSEQVDISFNEIRNHFSNLFQN